MILQGKFFTAGIVSAKRLTSSSGFVFLLLGSLMATGAAPLQIQIWDQHFSSSTYSHRADYQYDPAHPDPTHFATVSNHFASAQPLSDSIVSPSWNSDHNNYSGAPKLEAKADADLFRLETYASSAACDQQLGGSRAAALSKISFSPTTTGVGTFNLNLLGHREYYGAQFLRLTDLTLGQEVWSYGYIGLGDNAAQRFDSLLPANTTYQNEILWQPTGNGNESGFQLNLDTYLSATSTYELTMFATVESQAPETESVVIEWVNSPAAVPEPSTLALIGLGALTLWGQRRKSAAGR